jgi:hypothetical protein
MIRDKIIELATLEIGYIEEPNNNTKFGKWFGLNFVAWCGIFVSYIYFKAGLGIKGGGYWKGFAGCQTFAVKFAKKETLHPQKGDIVLFDWDNNKKYDHVGIFVKWLDSDTFETIEGNTSIGNNSNGGSVMLRIRNKKIAKFYNLID